MSALAPWLGHLLSFCPISPSGAGRNVRLWSWANGPSSALVSPQENHSLLPQPVLSPQGRAAPSLRPMPGHSSDAHRAIDGKKTRNGWAQLWALQAERFHVAGNSHLEITVGHELQKLYPFFGRGGERRELKLMKCNTANKAFHPFLSPFFVVVFSFFWRCMDWQQWEEDGLALVLSQALGWWHLQIPCRKGAPTCQSQLGRALWTVWPVPKPGREPSKKFFTGQ